jgi:hypothetical protein
VAAVVDDNKADKDDGVSDVSKGIDTKGVET